jgi:hypothetical protein
MRLMGTVRAQRGQALVFGTLWLIPLLVLLLALYAAGQYATAKVELQNTADASAYSVATIAARDYNFSAYMNRAMVANQVAMGQWVGLASWFQFTGQVIENVNMLCAAVPGLNAICAAVNSAYQTFKTAFVTGFMPVATNVLTFWLTALSDMQQAFHLLTAESLVQNLVLSGQVGPLQAGIVAQNDSKASVVQWPESAGSVPSEIYRLATLITDANEWWKYTERYNEGGSGTSPAGMARFAQVVNGSLDGFADSRRWDLGPVKILDSNIWRKLLPSWLADIIDSLSIVSISGSVSLSLARRGATQLKNQNGRYSWAALDTLENRNEFEVKVSYPRGIDFCKASKWGICVYYPCGIKHCSKSWDGSVDVPVGWGAAVAQNPKAGGSYVSTITAPNKSYSRAYEDTGTTYAVALLPPSVVQAKGYKGLSPYSDVADGQRDPSKTPTFTLLVSKKASDIPGLTGMLYDGSLAGSSSVGLPKSECASQMYALAQGTVRYARTSKYSSLFTPFWEGTLSDPGDKSKVMALVAARGASLSGGGCAGGLLP